MNTNKKSTELVKAEKEIKNLEKALEIMRKNIWVSAEAIAQQEGALNEKKDYLSELSKLEEAKLGKYDENSFLTFSIIDEDSLKRTEKKYKVAYVKNNRPIDQKKVNDFIQIIANNKYERAYPIIATTATEAIENGYEIIDTKKNKVEKKDAGDYLVILDGQHRTLAFLKCTMTKARVVPSTYIREGKNIGKYLVDINDVGTNWNQEDRFAVAALTSNDDLAHEIADRINDGFNPTTASLIYTGKKISSKQVKKLLRGEDWTLPKNSTKDIPRGNRFIQLCIEAKISVKYITKRYFINGFNSYAISVGDPAAFDALDKLKTQNLTEKELNGIKDDQGFIKILKETA